MTSSRGGIMNGLDNLSKWVISGMLSKHVRPDWVDPKYFLSKFIKKFINLKCFEFDYRTYVILLRI